MKKYILILTALLTAVTCGYAVAQKASAKSATFIADIHCDACVSRIEKSIPFEKGVRDVRTDLENKKVTVYYDSSRTNPEQILKAFGKIKMKAELAPDSKKMEEPGK